MRPGTCGMCTTHGSSTRAGLLERPGGDLPRPGPARPGLALPGPAAQVGPARPGPARPGAAGPAGAGGHFFTGGPGKDYLDGLNFLDLLDGWECAQPCTIQVSNVNALYDDLLNNTILHLSLIHRHWIRVGPTECGPAGSSCSIASSAPLSRHGESLQAKFV